MKQISLLFFVLLNLTACAANSSQQQSLNLPLIQNAPMRGDVNAPVKIVEFTDFECHFCGQVQPTLQQVLKTYPKEVSLVFKNFPLAMHSCARAAHMAAMCANEQGKFWEYRNLLFRNQRALKRSDLDNYAQQLDLNLGAFAQCVDQEKYASKIEEDFQEGVRMGVMGTPAFFVNGTPLFGAQPFAAFERLIKEHIAKQSRS